ncbi:MAG TPA: SpoIIE family protein phosphatase [Armatimonadota bacterium]
MQSSSSPELKGASVPPGCESIPIDALEHCPSPYLVLDPDLRLLYVNALAERLLQTPRAKLLGAELRQSFPEAQGAAFYREFRRALSEQTPVRFQEYYPPLSKWLEVSASPCQFGLSAYLVDVTARRQAEEERLHLQAKEQRALSEADAAARRLEAIRQVTDSALAHLSLGDLLPDLLFRIRRALWTETAAIHLLDADGKHLTLRACHGPGEVDEPPIPLGSGVIGQVAERAQPLVLEDLSQWRDSTQGLFGCTSVMAVPLLLEGRVLGVLHVGALARRGFTLDDLDLLRLVADRVALGVEAARFYQTMLFERERWQATVEAMLDPVTVCDAKGTVLYMNPAYSQLVERSVRPGLTLSEHPAHYQLFRSDGVLFQPQELPLQRAALRGEEVRGVEVVQQTTAGQRVIAVYNASPLHDSMGRVIGAVAVGRDVTQERLALEEQRRTEEALRESHRILEAIMEHVPEGLSIADAPDVRIRMVSRYGRELVGRPKGHLEGAPLGEHVEKWGLRQADGISLPAAEELPLSRAVLRGEVVKDQELVILRSDGRSVPVLCNAAPILGDAGRILGGIIAWRDITSLKVAQEALEDAYHREHYIAEVLQRALLPAQPTLEGEYQVATAYMPAVGHLEIGGDFYDVFDTADGQVALLLGDVSGKGVEAAAMAAATRSTVRAFVHEDSDPARALTRANAALFPQQSRAGSFVTLILVILDPASGRLSYSGAGHPPALVREPGGHVSSLHSEHLPLGVSPSTPYEAGEELLLPGGHLVLYTDGVCEARHGGDMLGLESISQELSELEDCSPGRVTEALMELAMRFTRSGLSDDAAVVVVRRSPLG